MKKKCHMIRFLGVGDDEGISIYLRSSEKSPTASLLCPGDQEPRIRLTAVTPEPHLHLMARAGEDKRDNLEDKGEGSPGDWSWYRGG